VQHFGKASPSGFPLTIPQRVREGAADRAMRELHQEAVLQLAAQKVRQRERALVKSAAYDEALSWIERIEREAP